MHPTLATLSILHDAEQEAAELEGEARARRLAEVEALRAQLDIDVEYRRVTLCRKINRANAEYWRYTPSWPPDFSDWVAPPRAVDTALSSALTGGFAAVRLDWSALRIDQEFTASHEVLRQRYVNLTGDRLSRVVISPEVWEMLRERHVPCPPVPTELRRRDRKRRREQGRR